MFSARFVTALAGAGVLLGLAPLAPGVGIRLYHQDAEAIARGNAFTATADNASAVFYNPAGITQLQGQQFEITTFFVGYDVQYRGRDGRTADTPNQVQEIGQAYFTTPLWNSPLYFGLGVYTPYGLASTWPDGAPFRSVATESKLMFVTVNPVLAWKINEQISVAAGVTVNASHIDLRRGIVAPDDEFQFDGDGIGVGFNVGLLWQPVKEHAFGLKFFSATDITYDGRVEINSRTPFLFPSSREDAEAGFDFPMHLTAGYSFRPTKAWNFEFDIDWTDWNRVNSVTVSRRSGDLVEAFDWKSSFTYMGGVTRYFENGLSLSAGYTFIEKSVGDRTFRPSVPDMDFHIASVGLRYEAPRWNAGITYQFGYGEREIRNSLPSPIGESVDGDYEFFSHAIAVSVGATF